MCVTNGLIKKVDVNKKNSVMCSKKYNSPAHIEAFGLKQALCVG